jgi:SPOR domain
MAAASVPALVTTYTGGEAPKLPVRNIRVVTEEATQSWGENFFIGLAHAQDNIPASEALPAELQMAGLAQRVDDGIRYVFRLSDTRYWVVVGSFHNLEEAYSFADRVNAADPGIGAFVGLISQSNHIPVIVGELLQKDQAEALRQRVMRLDFVARQRPFLSPD